MTVDEMISSYVEAWNARNAEELLALMHPGAAYYDAFWMETCVGRDLGRYFRDVMEEESYRYERVGELIETSGGVTLRYAAFDSASSADPKFHGAEILHIRDGRILSISDFYCDPNPEYLAEVAEIALRRHGVPSHTTAGLSGHKALKVRKRLERHLRQPQAFQNANRGVSDLAKLVSCCEEHLELIVAKHYGKTPGELISAQRVKHARSLIANAPDQPDILERAAEESGFESSADLIAVFVEFYGFHPQDICHNWPPSIQSLASTAD